MKSDQQDMSENEPVGEKLARIETKLDAALSGFRDHEARLRSVEDALAQSKGGKAVMLGSASIVGGLIVAIVEYFTRK
jgi:hypothetical protein